MKKSINPMLKSGQSIVGTWSDGETATEIEVFGLSGYDYVIIDNEHGCGTNPNWLELIRAAENSGIVPIFRVPGFTYEDNMKKVLDNGAGGVLVPNVSCKADVEQIIQYTRFPPLGNRGACPYKRSNDYMTKWGEIEYYARSNEEVTVIVLIETVKAVENFDEIISVPGLDCILFGRADLSVSMGIPGDYENPRLLSSIKTMIQKARDKKMPAGMVTFSYEDTLRWMTDNVDFISVGTGRAAEIRAHKELIQKIRNR